MAGKNYTSKRLLPVDLVYYEAYKSKIDAQDREQRLKQYGNFFKSSQKTHIPFFIWKGRG